MDATFPEPTADAIRSPAHVSGRLTVEVGANVTNLVANGQCSVGAFTYLGCRTVINDTDIGRYSSTGEDCLINPNTRSEDFMTIHPVATDPGGISGGFQDDPLYQAFRHTAYSNPQDEIARVRIGNDVAIGSKVVIAPGVRIGDGALVAATAFVTKDVPPFCLVAGNPGRRVRLRLTDSLRARIMARPWWTYDISQMSERDFSDPERFMDVLEAETAARQVGPWRPASRVFEG